MLAQDSGNVTLGLTSTATATAAPGVYPISAALTGTAAGNYTVTLTAAANLTITQASTSTLLTTSAATPYQAVPVTLTAMVSDSSTGSTGSPSGTVSFYDGTTLLGTSPLSAGVATLAVSALPLGASTATSVYSGDTNFAASTSTGCNRNGDGCGLYICAGPVRGQPVYCRQ